MAGRIGEAACLECGDCSDMAVKETAGGHLTASCHKCQGQVYTPRGTRSHRNLKARTRLDASDAPAPAAASAPPAAAAPPAAVQSTAPARAGFSLAGLRR